MANIIDYLKWRGDIDFSYSPFNEVDALILVQISYLNFDGIVSSDFKKQISLKDASEKFMNAQDFKTRSKLGPLINKDTIKLLEMAGQTERFGKVKLSGYRNNIDFKKEKQFAVYTAQLPDKSILVAFRGTDQSIVGWKEDFNMAFKMPIPAQTDALNYVNDAGKVFKNEIRIGGHSKGGNLAVYSAAFCKGKIQKHLKEVFNFDGPGFEKRFLQEPEFQFIKSKVKTFIPSGSVVGLIFDNVAKYTIIESTENGLMQHDALSWQILQNQIIRTNKISSESLFFEQTLKNWLNHTSPEKREVFVDTLFGILEAANAEKLDDITENWLTNSVKMLSYIKTIDPETRNIAFESFRMMIRSARKTGEKWLTKG